MDVDQVDEITSVDGRLARARKTIQMSVSRESMQAWV